MKIKITIIMLALSFQIVAQINKNQARQKEMKTLNSTYNSSEDQYASYKSNKSGKNQIKYGNNGDFVCESINYKRNHCNADTEGGVRLVRQLSRGTGYDRGSCLNNWGYDYYGVWVINGCRAEFATNRYEDHYGSNSGVVRCESYRFKRQVCRVNLRNANVSIIHQLGNASCSGNWGYNTSGIWVANGCKADFYVDSNYGSGNNQNDSDYVKCFSQNRRTQVCQVPDLDGVEIDQIQSGSAQSCRGNWGYSRDGIWVSNGCQATFKIQRYRANTYGNNGGSNNNPSWGDNNNTNLVKCKSKGYKYKACQVGQFNEIQLERVLDKSNCNNNWGINKQAGQIWVDKGCQGEFRIYR
jgi:hypothetical protein